MPSPPAARRSGGRRGRGGRCSSVGCPIRVGRSQLRADEHHLADRHRLGDVQDAALLDLRHAVGRARRLARLGVALGDVEALDDDRRRRRPANRAGTCSGRRSRAGARMTRSTLPRLPASLPASTTTVSPLRISGTFVARTGAVARPSQHLRRERDDLHVVAVAELARDRAEDAGAARVALVVDEHGRVLVEADVAAVRRGRTPWPCGR